MRRKSARNAQKASPEKTVKESETPPKTRRSRRRKRSPSKSSESEEEVAVTKRPSPSPEETPDTTTKSHSPSDDETSEEPVWKVTQTDEDTPKGEIQKLKICLTRPCPDSPDKNKPRRSKSNSQTEDDSTTSEDKLPRRTRSHGSPSLRNDGISSQDGDEDVDEKKGKGKSKGKHKSKIEKSPHLSEPEIQTNNEISENVQVTPQSPTINKPIDNENDYNKVDADKIDNENVQRHDESNSEESVHKADCDSDKIQVSEVVSNTEHKDSDDDDEPLSKIQKASTQNTEESAVVTIEESTVITTEEPTEITAEVPTEITAEEPTEITTKKTTEITPEESAEITLEIQQETVSQLEEEIEKEAPSKLKDSLSIEEQKNEDSSNTCGELSEEQKSATEIPAETSSIKDTEETVVENGSPTEEIGEQQPSENVSTEDAVISESEQTSMVQEPEKVSEKNIDDVENVIESTSELSKLEEPIKETGCSTNETTEPKQPTSRARSPRHWIKRDNSYLKPDAEEKEPTEEMGQIKPTKTKRKWQKMDSEASPLVKIDLESIQVVWPTIDFPEEPDLSVEIAKERRKSVSDTVAIKIERKVSVEYKSDFSERPSFDKQSSVSSTTQESEDNSNIIAFNRKISIVDDTASKLRPPPSPSKNPISNILYITNLVRPFTVKQLKELLERTGKINEEGFWTDRIKSKCYVQYETQEEAEATRNALHGVQWPIGNGKKLIIDYATEEDMNTAKNPPVPPPAAPVQETKVAVKENLEPVESKPPRIEEKVTKEMEKKRSEGPIREWDIGKKDIRRDRSRSRERSRKHKRSRSPPDDFISRKHKKEEESVPQKLMDDLFLKTKATPSIYWQPLSPEEIAMKQQQRLMRMEEHKRRLEESSRMKAREIGRGAFRRRYD